MDGLSKPEQIIKRLNELEIDTCALTDHGNVSGAIEFLKKMIKAKKKPILGIEGYVCKYNAKIQDSSNRSLTHLLIYAKNNQGWLDLIKLVSESNLPEHYYYRPRLSLEQLADFAGNLIILSGHLGSTLADVILHDNKVDIQEGITHLKQLQDIFGKDNVFLESQLIDKQNIKEMAILTNVVREISAKTGVKVVPTGDAHYCRREDADDQRVLLARALGNKTLAEARQDGALLCFFNSNNFHIPSYEDMLACGHTKEELDNTNYVASLIEEYTNILKPPILPQFPCPEKYTADEWLRELCRKGWREKIANVIPKEEQQVYIDRVKMELNTIGTFGFSDYFLIVEDIVQQVRKRGGLPNIGRGSAAGCLVSYLTGITQIDPIKYNLIFERFFNAGRGAGTLPDIDIDVPVALRDKIIEYIKDQYGHNKVAQMVTFQTIKGRGALKDVLRCYGVSFDEMNSITQHIQDEAKIADELQEMKEETGESSIIRWALENDKQGKLKEWCYIEDDELKGPYSKRFEQAIRLEGTKAAQSKHPAGVIITPVPVNEMCPMVYDAKNKTTVAGFEMGAIEDIGGIKFDILSLNFLDKMMGIKRILETGDI